MGAGIQRWWRSYEAECNEYDGVQSRESVNGVVTTRYKDGRINVQWEQTGHTMSYGRPRFIGYNPRTGEVYEIPDPDVTFTAVPFSSR